MLVISVLEMVTSRLSHCNKRKFVRTFRSSYRAEFHCKARINVSKLRTVFLELMHAAVYILQFSLRAVLKTIVE